MSLPRNYFSLSLRHEENTKRMTGVSMGQRVGVPGQCINGVIGGVDSPFQGDNITGKYMSSNDLETSGV